MVCWWVIVGGLLSCWRLAKSLESQPPKNIWVSENKTNMNKELDFKHSYTHAHTFWHMCLTKHKHPHMHRPWTHASTELHKVMYSRMNVKL